jgi:hypothetical protein
MAVFAVAVVLATIYHPFALMEAATTPSGITSRSVSYAARFLTATSSITRPPLPLTSAPWQWPWANCLDSTRFSRRVCYLFYLSAPCALWFKAQCCGSSSATSIIGTRRGGSTQ